MKNGLIGKWKKLERINNSKLYIDETNLHNQLIKNISHSIWEWDSATDTIQIIKHKNMPKRIQYNSFNQFVNIFINSEDANLILESFNKLKNNEIDKAEMHYRFKDNNDRWYVSFVIASKNSQNKTIKIKGINMEISYQKNIEKALFKKTYCDKLTDMRNKTRLIEDYKNLINGNIENDIAFVFIDIDNFKYINNIYGYTFGDLVLLSLSEIIQKKYTISQMTSRIEADRFLIIFKNFESRAKLETELQEFIEKINSSIFFAEQKECISISVGVSYLGDHGIDFEDLYKHSEIALAYAKKNGKQQLKVYERVFFDNINKSIQITNQLKTAMKTDEFRLFYQPILDKEENIVGFEALIRWFHKDKIVPPLEFIPVAEESGLIKDIELIVFEKAFKQVREWVENKNFKGFVSINLSTCGLINKNIYEYLKELLKKYEIPPNFIEIEITESVLIKDMQNIKEILKKLKSLGFIISLDDFGTGYSSLSYLRELPIDKIKLDKSFIDSSFKNKKDEIILKSIIDLGHLLNFQIVAEGIETEVQKSFLKELKCDYFQGYYFSKPLSVDNVVDFYL